MAAMSAIDLYEILKRVPNTEAAEARSAADSVAIAGDAATKADVANLENRLTWRMILFIAPLYALSISTMFQMGRLDASVSELNAKVSELGVRVGQLETGMSQLTTEVRRNSADLKRLAAGAGGDSAEFEAIGGRGKR